MIRAVTVTNYLGESKRFELAFPEKSGFAVQSISGLGPSKADINTTEISTNDGSLYNSARVNSRNIVMSLKLMFTPQIEDTRQDSYKYFPIKKRVTLLIETDNRICETYGYVESNEPDIFSSDETTQISIVCPDPYFYSAGPDGTNTTIFYGVEPLFEFAFSNESLTESLIEFGEIKNETEQTVYYSGDAEIGVVITIHAIGNVRNITIYNTGTREVMRIDTDKLEKLTGSGMVAGDEIIISTIKGDKSITLLRNGIYTNILNCLDKDSDWFQLSKGDNIFAYVVEEGTTNVQFKIDVSYMTDEEYATCMTDTFNKLEYRNIPESKLTGEKWMEKSVNIGDQLSQVIGIYYPYRIDNYVKYVRSQKFYGRYMDDWYIMNPSKEELLDLLDHIHQIAEEYGIHINRKKTRIVKISSTYKFLQIKYSLTDSGKVIKRINPKRVTAMRRKLKRLAVKVKNEEISYENVENMFRSWMGGFYKLLSKEQRKNLIGLYEDLFEKSIEIVNKKMIIVDKTR